MTSDELEDALLSLSDREFEACPNWPQSAISGAGCISLTYNEF